MLPEHHRRKQVEHRIKVLSSAKRAFGRVQTEPYTKDKNGKEGQAENRESTANNCLLQQGSLLKREPIKYRDIYPVGSIKSTK